MTSLAHPYSSILMKNKWRKVRDAYSENKWYLTKFYVSLHCWVHVEPMLHGASIFDSVQIMEEIGHVTHMYAILLFIQSNFSSKFGFWSTFKLFELDQKRYFQQLVIT